ncbi:BTB/POZ domain-containing protein 19 isoform X1 [Petromyzon marinus]|uniref:BTB/POZ domain-containing protein 19 isoform X1 n=1 Tax=Petromyzon marinus TaxID=7757 RepID=A0AAJ7SYU0_PETMA|nr:BTB/POZ domain-containing protein 19 isoform X1 [Petromyzon marinus]
MASGDPAAFSVCMARLLHSASYADITLVIGSERQEVRAHRCVLAARSDALAAMLSHSAAASDGTALCLALPDVCSATFPAFLEFVYTNRVALRAANVLDLLTYAIEFGVEDLRQLCVRHLLSELNSGMACEALQASVVYGQKELRDSSVHFIEKHVRDVVRTPGFWELSDHALSVLLQSDELDIDEADLITAVTQWANVNSAVLGEPVSKVAQGVLGGLRLLLLSPEELASLEQQSMREQVIPVEMVAAAWRFHALRRAEGIPRHCLRCRKGTRPRDHHVYLKS